MPVPEFPRSAFTEGSLKGISLFFIETDVPLILILEPIAFKALAVDIGSCPFRKPQISIS